MTADFPAKPHDTGAPSLSTARTVKSADQVDGDGSLQKSLAFALRGSIATLTARVAEVHQQIREVELKVDQANGRPKCLTTELVGNQVRDQLLPLVHGSMKGVTDQLDTFKKQLPGSIGLQLQTALITVKQDLQRLSADNQGGRSVDDGLKNIQPLLTHLLTLLTPLTQIPTTFNNFQQSVYSCLQKQAEAIVKQEKTAGQLQQDAKRIVDSIAQIVRANDRNSVQNQKDMIETSNSQTTEIVRLVESRFSAILDDKLGGIETKLKEHVDTKIACLEAALMEAIRTRAIPLEPRGPPDFASLSVPETASEEKTLDGADLDQVTRNIPYNRKRHLSVSSHTASEPDCDQDLVPCQPDGGALESPLAGALLPTGLTEPIDTSDHAGAGKSDSIGSEGNKEVNGSFNSAKERRKRRRLTVSPEANELPPTGFVDVESARYDSH